MAAYTPAARLAAGGRERLLGKITAAVAESNLAYSRSGVYVNLRLVRAFEVAYTESSGMETDLYRLQDPSDGQMDEVHGLRDRYGADVVMLVRTEADWGGMAFQLAEPDDPWMEAWAFGVAAELGLGDSTDFGNYSIGNFTLAHEVGHIMGADHEVGNPSGDLGVFAFSHGYCFPTGEGTIMSYCWPGLGFFANPNLTIPRTGASLESEGWQPLPSVPRGPLGVAGVADNARTLNLTAAFVAAFRPESTPTCLGETATIVGTNGADVLEGTSGRDVIAGLGGNDVIKGLGGNDVICGGDGADRINGGPGNDRIAGEAGNDVIVGGGGDDMASGGNGNDTLQGQLGNDTLEGGAGSDNLDGGAGSDALDGGPGTDTCYGETRQACELP